MKVRAMTNENMKEEGRIQVEEGPRLSLSRKYLGWLLTLDIDCILPVDLNAGYTSGLCS